MKQPTYKPETWITFQQGETGGFGRIVGATFDGEAWVYSVAGANADGSHHAVRETEVSQLFQNNSWLTPTTAASSSSAYQDTPAA